MMPRYKPDPVTHADTGLITPPGHTEGSFGPFDNSQLKLVQRPLDNSANLHTSGAVRLNITAVAEMMLIKPNIA